MQVQKKIKVLASRKNGIVTAKDVSRRGMSRGNLSYLVKKGELERVSRGLYSLPDAWDDGLYAQQARFSRGIYGLRTALYLWDLTDRTPKGYEMFFPFGYNLTSVKASNVPCRQIKKDWYETDIGTCLTPAGNKVRVYSRERTICDTLRPVNHIDKHTILESIRRYLDSPSRNIPLLTRTAHRLRVESKLRPILEILL